MIPVQLGPKIYYCRLVRLGLWESFHYKSCWNIFLQENEASMYVGLSVYLSDFSQNLFRRLVVEYFPPYLLCNVSHDACCGMFPSSQVLRGFLQSLFVVVWFPQAQSDQPTIVNLAAGALAHRLQHRTACKIQTGRQGAPKWLKGSGQVFTPRFLGAPVP